MEEQTIHLEEPSLPPRLPGEESSSTSDVSQIGISNPSKIPIRPQKIRKLSYTPAIDYTVEEIKPQSTIAEADASKAIVVSTTTTIAAPKTRRRNPSRSPVSLPKVIKPLSTAGEIAVAIDHLRSVDPILANVIDNHPPPTFDSNQPPFLALTKSILYQQLAYKAGTSIFTRFVTLCGGENDVVPETVLSLTPQQLKQIGVSGRKRPDVLPVSDSGVRKGVQLLYMLDELPRPSQMEQLCGKWKPYRSVGAWYIWRFVEGKGTPASGSTAAALLNGGIVVQQQFGQSEQVKQQQQQQLQLQLLEPINSLGNLGACIWG